MHRPGLFRFTRTSHTLMIPVGETRKMAGGIQSGTPSGLPAGLQARPKGLLEHGWGAFRGAVQAAKGRIRWRRGSRTALATRGWPLTKSARGRSALGPLGLATTRRLVGAGVANPRHGRFYPQPHRGNASGKEITPGRRQRARPEPKSASGVASARPCA